MSGSYRIDITFEELYKNFYIQNTDTESGKYRVNIFKRPDKDGLNEIYVGAVEMSLGRWKIVGDYSEEIRDLNEAIRKAVNIFLRCDSEYNDVLNEFNKVLK